MDSILGDTDHHALGLSEAESLLNRLRGLGEPEPKLIGSAQPRPTASTLREGKFTVYGHEVSLTPPIEWRQDPYGSRSWCYQLHSLIWLTPTFLAYSNSGNEAALRVALAVIDDWMSQHPEGATVSEFAWYDMAVSQRAPSLAYALRAGLSAGLLDGNAAATLLRMCERHGLVLADDALYSAGHNHGLAQDEALYLLARQLPVLPAANRWSGQALKRMRETLNATVSGVEGAHLEHSSAYQFAIARMVSRLCTTVTEWPELHELRNRLSRTAAWHVTPGGKIAQLGDSNDDGAPDWAVTESSRQQGVRALYEAGNAFVRSGDSYLAVSAGYHSSAHKHADDTGFLLVERGTIVFGDAGRWGYYEDEPDRRYARSAHAHNVLTVDDRDFGLSTAEPYGSSLLLASEADDWYAILVFNPMLAAQGVAHRRLLLYRPREAMIVIDEVRSQEAHEYARRFHLGRELEARLREPGQVAVEGGGISATLTDLGGGATVEIARGLDEPARSGWTYPGDRERIAIDTVTMRCRAQDATLAAALTLGEADLTVQRAAWDGDDVVVTADRGAVEVRLAPDERRAEIRSSVPPADRR